MSDTETKDAGDEARDGPSGELMQGLAAAIAEADPDRAKALVGDLRAPDLADAMELLDGDERIALIQLLGSHFDFEVLSELEESVRDQISEALPNDVIARAVTELESDDAAYILEGLKDADKEEVLAQIPTVDRAALERNLEYGEGTAGRLMQGDFVAVPPFWSIGQVIDYMRESEDLPESFSEIFVVDPAHRVLGSVNLSRLLRTKRHVGIGEIMQGDLETVLATADERDVARQFERYDLMSAPVVDVGNRLVGVVTVDDVVEVIQEGADEDVLKIAGVGDESLADSVLETVKSRVPWLIINLGTAILASGVINAFGATIQQMVALAVLMPIVASIGGNAGMQTMAVTVRALATSKLGTVNSPRVVTREALVGVANGLVMSVIAAVVVYAWFGSGMLGAVIGLAIIVNLFVAALAGILIPLAFERYNLDPAPASGVFVTMVTDCVGFFAFLGLAAIWLAK